MRTADEAAAYLTKLRSIVRYLGTCDGNMDEGSMRCDVNVSVRKPGGALGTRCEIKNVNSIRFVKQAIEYEARRQVEIIEGGGKIEQETRLFDPGRGETRSMRSKEDAHDYRYFPDPDLLPLVLTPGLRRRASRRRCRSCPTRGRARFIERLRAVALRRRRAGGGEGDGGVLRGRGQGPRRQAGGQLGDRRLLRHAEPPRRRDRRVAGERGAISASCST